MEFLESTLGGATLFIFILLLIIAFVPTIISIFRKVKGAKLILAVNLLCPIFFYFNSVLPTVVWLILIICALTFKKKQITYRSKT